MFRGEAPTNVSEGAVIEASGTVDRLPARDYIGAEAADLAPESPDAEAQRWEHERELYKEKEQDPGAGE